LADHSQKNGLKINNAEKILATLNSPVVLSHNDLLPGNIIYDEEKGSFTHWLSALSTATFAIRIDAVY
jgi:hypothetical protein